jgi:hypothetical protein
MAAKRRTLSQYGEGQPADAHLHPRGPINMNPGTNGIGWSLQNAPRRPPPFRRPDMPDPTRPRFGDFQTAPNAVKRFSYDTGPEQPQLLYAQPPDPRSDVRIRKAPAGVRNPNRRLTA